MIRIDPGSPDPGTVRLAAEVIRRGGVVCYPADTVYGLGCDPLCREALQRIFRIKGRPEDRGVLVLVPDLETVCRLAAEIPAEAASLMERCWPGPLTLILKARPGLPAELTGAGSTIGVRRPSNAFLEAWMVELGGPLVSTSANRSGEATPSDPLQLRRLFEASVDLFLESVHPLPGIPSTVVDFSRRPFRVVREGVLAAEVAEVVGPHAVRPSCSS